MFNPETMFREGVSPLLIKKKHFPNVQNHGAFKYIFFNLFDFYQKKILKSQNTSGRIF